MQPKLKRQVATVASGKAFSSSQTEASFDMDKWREFVQESQLGSITVKKYYCGDVPLGFYGYARIAQEVLADAVEVGAVVLPSAYMAEDFEFLWNNIRPASMAQISLRLKSEPGSPGSVGVQIGYFLKEDTRMASEAIEIILRSFCGKINDMGL